VTGIAWAKLSWPDRPMRQPNTNNR